MLVLSGIEEVEDESGEYGSWLSDRLGKTGAGIAIGAAVLGTGFAANRYMNLGIGDKTMNLVNRISGSTTAGAIGKAVAPAAAGMAVAAVTGGGDQAAAQQAQQAQQAQAEQAYMQQVDAEQAAAKSTPKAGISPWIPLGIIATAAAGWFAFKE